MFRKTNIGGLIQFDPKKAGKELLSMFTAKHGVLLQVADAYGVAPTTVRRWITSLEYEGVSMMPRIEKIRERAIETGER